MYLPSLLQGWSLYGDDETDMIEYLETWRRASEDQHEDQQTKNSTHRL